MDTNHRNCPVSVRDARSPLARLGRRPARSPLGKIRTALDRLLRHPVTDAVVMVAILASVVLLLVEMQLPRENDLFLKVQFAGNVFTAFFILELALRWFTAPSTRRFWSEYWLDVLAVLPSFRPARLLRMARMLRVLRAFRTLRFLRLLRIYRFGVLMRRFAGGCSRYNFEDILREDIVHYQGKFMDQIWLVPDLYRLLTNLLEDGRVHPKARVMIHTALAYLITPFEVLPRQVYGPEGYIDQVYVCLVTLNKLREELPDWLIEENWEGEGEVLEIVDEELPRLAEFLRGDTEETLAKYLGWSTSQQTE